jgi:hypothetical protein
MTRLLSLLSHVEWWTGRGAASVPFGEGRLLFWDGLREWPAGPTMQAVNSNSQLSLAPGGLSDGLFGMVGQSCRPPLERGTAGQSAS